MRRFLLLAHRAPTSPEFRLEDLPGAGRVDLVCRFLASALVLSHGIRKDAVAEILLQGPPDPPRAVRFDGAALERFNPDERSTAALLQRALGVRPTGAYPQPSTPGVTVRRLALADLLEGPVVLVEEGGEDVRAADLPEGAVFVLGDDRGFTEEEAATLETRAASVVSVGPRSLHADHCVVLLQNELDRRKREDGRRKEEEG